MHLFGTTLTPPLYYKQHFVYSTPINILVPRAPRFRSLSRESPGRSHLRLDADWTKYNACAFENIYQEQ